MQPFPLDSERLPHRYEPLLTVVIVNYNGWADVCRLVSSLAGTPEVARGACEVLVVDNASQDPAPPELARLGPGIRLIARRENGGFAAGVNTGWRASRSPWILVLNPDVVIPQGELTPIFAQVERYQAQVEEAPGIVGFALRNPDGTRQPSVGAFPSLARTLWEQLIPRHRRKYQPGWRIQGGAVDWVTGACVLLNTRMLAALGGMDEDFFLYHEEVALCRAARNIGWRIVYDPSVEVVHLHPLQNRSISPKMRVIIRNSKLLYFRKHLPRWQFRALAGAIHAEARIQGLSAKVQGRIEEARAWRTIAEMALAFRAGVEPRGRDVLRLAELVSSPACPEDSAAVGTPSTAVPAGKRRGPLATAPLQPRKDGPACR